MHQNPQGNGSKEIDTTRVYCLNHGFSIYSYITYEY